MENFKQDNDLSILLVRRVKTLPKEDWIRFQDMFHRWEFPMEFYDLIPDWWVKGSSLHRASNLINRVCEFFNENITNKEMLKYHNVYRGRMTEQEYEYWYTTVRPIDGESKIVDDYYHRSCYIMNMEWWKDDVFEKIVSALEPPLN